MRAMNRNELAVAAAKMTTKPTGKIYTIYDSNGDKVSVIDGRRLRRREIANTIRAWRNAGYKVKT